MCECFIFYPFGPIIRLILHSTVPTISRNDAMAFAGCANMMMMSMSKMCIKLSQPVFLMHKVQAYTFSCTQVGFQTERSFTHLIRSLQAYQSNIAQMWENSHLNNLQQVNHHSRSSKIALSFLQVIYRFPLLMSTNTFFILHSVYFTTQCDGKRKIIMKYKSNTQKLY